MRRSYENTIEKFHLRAADVDDYMALRAYEKTRWVDGDGYQYYLSRDNLKSTNQKGGALARFFNGNMYTESNVRLYADRISNGDISVVSFTAKNAHDKIKFYTRTHDYEYFKSFNEFTHSQYLEKRRIDYVNKSCHTIEDIKIMALDRFNITVVSNSYVNNETAIDFVCNCKEHENVVQSMSWAQMISKNRPCRLCSKIENRKSIELSAKLKFERKLSSVNTRNPDIIVLGEYTTAHKKIKCKCKKCGRFIYLRPDHILIGIGCGKCTKSLGEKLVEAYLLGIGVMFKTQYIFKDCKMNKRAMPFDFYLPTLGIAIEFDGAQHFVPADAFGGVDGFHKIRARDSFKTKYCEDNGITLIRIPFTEIKNISTLLDSYLLQKCS